MAKIRLPLLAERAVAEASAARVRISQTYEVHLRENVTTSGTAITCSKGCNHCCYHPVLVSLFEGVSLYRWLLDNGLWNTALKTKLEAADSHVKDLALDVWMLSMIPCPMLASDGSCSVHPARPFSCRVTYSIGDPHYCHPHQLGESTGILPKRDILDEMNQAEAALMKPARLPHFKMPLAKAILAGEKICKDDLDMESWLEAFQ